MLSKLLDRMEKLTLSVGRMILIFTATGIVIGTILYILWAGASAIINDESDVEPLAFDSSFQKPNENPIEEIDRLERLSQAKKSFASAYQDVANQIKLTSKNLRKEYLEITGRYRDLSEKPENQVNMRELAQISQRMSDELSKSCVNGDTAFKQQFDNIERDILQISQKFNVEKDAISTNYQKKLQAMISQNGHCIKQSQLVKGIAENLKKAYPGDWGMPIKNISPDGARAKATLEQAVGNKYQRLSRYYDDEALNNYFESLSKYSASLATYYSNIALDLENTNKMTALNAQILALDITSKIEAHEDAGKSEYSRYMSETRSSVGSTYGERLLYKLGAILSISGILFYVLLAVLLFIIIFALERHNRNLKSLVNMEKDPSSNNNS
jgi:hypothetical protein